MTDDIADVLIIGSGASGAAFAWSIADTKMRVVCLEQGDWMKPGDYPSTGRDWEARAMGDYSPSPNRRARPEDYPINDDASPIKVVNFNGVGGGTVLDFVDVTGKVAPNRWTFDWSEFTVALDATGNTNGNVILQVDLLSGGYAAMDNFRIAAADTSGDVGDPTNPVPEPYMLALLGIGLCALRLGRARRG